MRPFPWRNRQWLIACFALCLLGALFPMASLGAVDPLSPIVAQSPVASTQPVVSAAQPATQAVAPLAETTQPVTEATQPLTQAATQATQPVTQAVTEATQPVTQAATQATQPVTQAASQATQAATQAVSQATQPATQAVNQAAEVATQATQSAGSTAASAASGSSSETSSTGPGVEAAGGSKRGGNQGAAAGTRANPPQGHGDSAQAAAGGGALAIESVGLPSGLALSAQQPSLTTFELASLICWLPARLGFVPGLTLVDSLLTEMGLAVPVAVDASPITRAFPFPFADGAWTAGTQPVEVTAPGAGGLLDTFLQPLDKENVEVIVLALLGAALVLLGLAALPRDTYRVGMLSAIPFDLRYYIAASGFAVGLSVGIVYFLSRIQ